MLVLIRYYETFLSPAVSNSPPPQKYEFNMDNLSKPELLTLLSIMEGELEARDLVIEALRVSPRHKLTAPSRASSPNPPVGSGACGDTFAELC